MTEPVFDFDEEIDRREVPALKPHRRVLGADGAHLFPAGVADMDFKPPPPVLEAMRKRLEHGVFGYETVPDGLMPALTGWLQTRHSWRVEQSQILC
jgi:cystathionine beta-lyase